MSTESATRAPRGAQTVATLALIVLVALALRPPVTAVAPLLEAIQRDLQVSAAFGGVLTTLPVVCLGVFAFVAPKLRQRFSDERVVVGCLVVLVFGNALRAVGSAVALLAGTVIAGAGIAVANVALPGLIKRDFPHNVPVVTAAYTVCLTLGGAMAASIVVPLGQALGSQWRLPLGSLAVPAVLTLVVSLFALRHTSGARAAAIHPAALRRSPLAWQVTAFMGLQSLMAYVVFGWLPTVAQSRGLSPETAGLLLGVQAGIQAVGSMAVPVLCHRLRDQRLIAAGVAVVTAVGFTGIVLAPAPGGVWASTVVLGLSQGAAFGLALTLFGFRSPDSDTTAALSGMAQGAGYLIAATGPLAVGLLHEWSGNWIAPLLFVLAVCAAQFGAGMLAGRPLQVDSVIRRVTPR
ncbi:MFS transporter [Saccharopolyspora erythraea]|uniref:CynX/NimT family MFS transporter n=1 Tax=Saccharopolyspora erythraea TaxID=1836 RepID=UPI001BAAF56C|nr:MFS transporter [Saccharopolyspora erythraea]QUH04512.1 MFS transporter [Saccharopolyspora erythraea]